MNNNWGDIGLISHIPNESFLFIHYSLKMLPETQYFNIDSASDVAADNVKCYLPDSVIASWCDNIRTYQIAFISISFQNLWSSLSIAFSKWKHIRVYVYFPVWFESQLVSLFSLRSACYCIWLIYFDITTEIIWLWLKHLILIWDFYWMITMLEGNRQATRILASQIIDYSSSDLILINPKKKLKLERMQRIKKNWIWWCKNTSRMYT